jgi:hypothetical protein
MGSAGGVRAATESNPTIRSSAVNPHAEPPVVEAAPVESYPTFERRRQGA